MTEAREDFADFTEANYRHILRMAKKRYAFKPFGTESAEPHVLWRHDVDLSLHRALSMAQIEHEEGVCATYFLLLHSRFYNLFEDVIADKARQILGLGHHLGLHFDAAFYLSYLDHYGIEERVAFERDILVKLFEMPVEAVSFHSPEAGNMLAYGEKQIAGMVNAYGAELRRNYSYVSDSNGYWRFENIADVLALGKSCRLQVLTHPGWWVPEPMSPRQRVTRCIDGRAEAHHRRYDDLIYYSGRKNVR